MKEFILIPKIMFEMLSPSKKNNNIIHTNTKVNNNKTKKEKN